MDSLKSRITPALATAVVILLSAKGVEAHGHHMDNIAEGSYMSADPIVC